MTIELLVVEDNEKHIAQARQYFDARADVVQVTYATTLAEAQVAMNTKKFEGVISDIFFPTGKSGEDDREIRRDLASKLSSRYMDVTVEWEYGSAQPPCGIYVVEGAQERRIPVVLNTDQYHHSTRIGPVNNWNNMNAKSVRIIESETRHDEPAESKNWRDAYAAIACLCEGLDAWKIEWMHDLEREVAEYGLNLERARKEGSQMARSRHEVDFPIDVAEKILKQESLELKAKQIKLQPVIDKYKI